MEEIGIDEFIYDVEKENHDKVEIIDGFRDLDEKAMAEFKGVYSIGMDIEDLLHCQKYFTSESRDPSIAEIKLLDTYWSDHCRHTTFMTKINKMEVEEGSYKALFEESIEEYLASRKYVYGDREKPISLMDMEIGRAHV